ncbi:MAG TPA: hypothetical protein VMH61_03745 [Candidatus Acidoferrales bacterium]|nr:hypothetical protein [Candidatus Acidoferrales bacterium]
MPIRVLIAAILAGVVTFLFGFVSHMLFDTDAKLFGRVADEAPLLASVARSLPGPGVYALPQMPQTQGMGGKAKAAAMQSYMEAIKGRPFTLIVQTAPRATFIDPRQLVNQLLGDIASCLCVAIILSLAAPASYGGRVVVAIFAVLTGALMVRIPQGNWYGFGRSWTTISLGDDVVRMLGGALVLAAMIRPRR